MQQLEDTAKRVRDLAPPCDYWTLRLVAEESEELSVRQGVAEPSWIGTRRGAMVTLVRGAGLGYAATSDLSEPGLRSAFSRAAYWAELHGSLGLFDASLYPKSDVRTDYRTPVAEPWDARSTADKLSLLQDACTALKIDERIVDWSAWLGYRCVSQLAGDRRRRTLGPSARVCKSGARGRGACAGLRPSGAAGAVSTAPGREAWSASPGRDSGPTHRAWRRKPSPCSTPRSVPPAPGTCC